MPFHDKFTGKLMPSEDSDVGFARQANTDRDNFATPADRAVANGIRQFQSGVGSTVRAPLEALQNNPSGIARRQIEDQMRASRGGGRTSPADRAEADRLIAEAAAETRRRRAAGETVERQPLPDELRTHPEVGYVDHNGRRKFPR